jgi:hypothetical protein
MGGNSTEKEDEVSYWSRAYNIGYNILDFITWKSLSKKARISELEEDIKKRDSEASRLRRLIDSSTESQVTLSRRIMSIEGNHRKERLKWAKRNGLLEVSNERLEERLGNTYKELKEVRVAYERVKEIIAANDGLEGAMLELEEFHKKVGLEVPNAEKNALELIRRQRAFVKRAYEEVEQARRGNVLGGAYVKKVEKRVMFVLDEKNRVEAMSKAAVDIIGEEVTGKSVDYVSNSLGIMMRYVAPTYEEEFNATVGSIGDSKDVRLNVSFERYFGQHIGAIVVVEP